MVRSDLSAAGMFSLDNRIPLQFSMFLLPGDLWLGANVVQGSVDPDEFYVIKPTLSGVIAPVLRRGLGGKKSNDLTSAGPHTRSHTECADARTERRTILYDDQDVLTWPITPSRLKKHYSASGPAKARIWSGKGRDRGTLYIVQEARKQWHRSAGCCWRTYTLKKADNPDHGRA